jgi:hypothetical protein
MWRRRQCEKALRGIALLLALLLPATPVATQEPDTWQRTLTGAANGNDQALAVAVDRRGNGIAAGTTTSSTTGEDFTVAKFGR